MNLEILSLGGYGQFVWPAFIFSFISCLILYLKTKEELKIQEKIFFSEYKHLQAEKIKTTGRKKEVQEAFSTSSI